MKSIHREKPVCCTSHSTGHQQSSTPGASFSWSLSEGRVARLVMTAISSGGNKEPLLMETVGTAKRERKPKQRLECRVSVSMTPRINGTHLFDLDLHDRYLCFLKWETRFGTLLLKDCSSSSSGTGVFLELFYLLRLSDEGMRGLFFGLVGKRYRTGSQTGEAARGA